MGEDVLGQVVLEVITDDSQARAAISDIKAAATEITETAAILEIGAEDTQAAEAIAGIEAAATVLDETAPVIEVDAETEAASDALRGIKTDTEGVGAAGKQTTSEFSDGVKVLGQDLDSFLTNPMAAAKGAATNLLGAITPAAAAIGGLAAAAGAAGYAILQVASSAADAMEQLENMSAMTGETTGTLESLNQMVAEAGLTNLDLGRTLSKINEELGSAKPGEFTKALDMLGISTSDMSGKTKDAVTVLDEVRSVLLSIPDPTERAQLAQQVLGGRMRELIPLLLNSEKGIKDTKEEMVKWGIVTDELTKNKLKAFDEASDKLGRGVEVLKKYLAGGVMTFLEWNTPLSLLIDNTKKATDEHKGESKSLEIKLRQYDAMKAKKMDEEAKKHAAELKKLREETEKSLRPMEDLADKLKQQMKEFTKNDLVRAYANEILAAAAKQTELGEALSDSSLEFVRMALEVKRTKEAHHGFVAAIDDGIRQTALLDINLATLKETISKLGKELEAASIKPTFDLAIPPAESINETIKSLAANSGQAADAMHKFPDPLKSSKDHAKELRQEISTIFNDMEKGIIDIVVNWKGGWQSMIGVMEEVGKGFLRILLKEFLTPLTTLFNDLATAMAKALTKTFTDSLRETIGSIFGITRDVGEAAAEAGSAAGGAAAEGGESMAGQIMGGAIAAAGSILGSVIGALIVRRDTQEIEVNTRYTKLHCEGIEGWIRDGLLPATWEGNTRLGNIYGAIEDFKWMSMERLNPLETIGWSICSKLDDIKNELAALPEAQGGMDYVPRDMLVRVHKGEEIVPPGGVGSKPMIINFNVNAMDARGVAEFMRDRAYPELLRLIGMDRAGARTRLNLALSGRRA